MSTPSAFSKGLEGVIAGETSICSLEQGGLLYRGYEIHDLAQHATYEEVAFLLLEGHKPNPDELRRFRAELLAERPLPAVVVDFLHHSGPMLRSGSAVPMDILRTAVSMLGNLDPESQSIAPDANLRKAKRLLAKTPTIIGHMQNVIDEREIVGRETGGDPKLSMAANLLYMMLGHHAPEDHNRTLDVSLMLYAEHDYNASTFTARCIAGTLSDLHGAVTGAIAALKGPLHGGANEAAMEMLKEIRLELNRGVSVADFMHNAFAHKRKLMGFGHRVYKNGDHRAPILNALGRKLAEKKGPDSLKWFQIGDQVEKIMLDEKQIHPNVDFPCGMTYYVMGIPVPQYTPIFVAARMAGWCAHVIEQLANNRLIRPGSLYVGPAQRPWRS